MPRRCTICTHPSRESIDAALLTGESAAAVARRIGVSSDAMERHRINHLAPRAAAAARLSASSREVLAPIARARQIAAGAPPLPAEALDLDGLSATLARALARLETAADEAASEKARLALAALTGQITRAVESVARLRGIGVQPATERQDFRVVINLSGRGEMLALRGQVPD